MSVANLCRCDGDGRNESESDGVEVTQRGVIEEWG